MKENILIEICNEKCLHSEILGTPSTNFKCYRTGTFYVSCNAKSL